MPIGILLNISITSQLILYIYGLLNRKLQHVVGKPSRTGYNLKGGIEMILHTGRFSRSAANDLRQPAEK